jgi:2-polyprenyl-3-methyl-5-hydroxy-6-metoxy-1,4-benzoquinol methylase
MKALLREVTPPFLWRLAAKLIHRGNHPQAVVHGQQMNADYYDETFKLKKQLKIHYTKAFHYPLWAVVADRVRQLQTQSVLDMGCGPGQMASLFWDIGIPRYLGLDFSASQIDYARKICPEYQFVVADAFATNLIEDHPYDTFLATEFLEHIEDDVEIVKRIRPGAHVVISVPNFPHPAHVRWFNCIQEVADRYQPYLQSLEVSELRINQRGRRFFILQGVR